MLAWLLEQLCSVVRSILRILGLGSDPSIEEGTRVTVRTVTGQAVSLLLKPTWTIRDVKSQLCSQLGAKPDELRIIFAGKELRDDVSIQSCDLGSQSILHAVRVENKASKQQSIKKSETFHGSVPISETLVDLQLTGEARHVAGKEKRAHFYSWCDELQKLVSAKLRVECASCRDGAIVLHADPCSWEDVLQAGRIFGYCEVCRDTTVALFYFKCGELNPLHIGHVSLPLYLIKSNLAGVPCLACTDIQDPVLVFSCAEGHVICTECFGDYARSRLGERQYILDPEVGYTLPCPVGCDKSLITEPAHFKLLGLDNYDRYLRFGAEELVLQGGGVLCPQPGCGAGILPDGGGDDCRRIACKECNYVFCRDCSMGAHLGECLPCGGPESLERGSEYRSMDPADPRASRARWQGADPSSVTIRVNTKPCPGCRTPTERSGGCMHMICTKPGCGLSWCWVCQLEWERDCMANHWFG